MAISIIENNKTFTPLIFYSEFLEKLALFYKENKGKEIVFKFFENGDEEIHNSRYIIEPIALPLLLSIIEQLSKFHKKPLHILLHNNPATIDALEFLYKADFFKNAGNVNEYDFKGNNILQFDERYFGAFKGKLIKRDHLVRYYSNSEYNFNLISKSYQDEVEIRDNLLSSVTYRVRSHFQELLFENEFTSNYHNLYIDILSELITNGVLHSGSTTYAMMFVDRFKTKFSISDNGIGLKLSLDKKTEFGFYYSKNEFQIAVSDESKQIPQPYIDNFIVIFETLFYSSLKERRGLFDLMLSVVIQSKGIFRLHTDNCQIVISNRIFKHLRKIYDCRESIFNTHILFELKKINEKDYKENILKSKVEMKSLLVNLFNKVIEYYSDETRYSSIRFFNVKFRGVHIEVEIPNS